MEILLIRYYIRNTLGSGGNTIAAGHYINVLWDDEALAFIVQEFDSSSDITPVIRPFGPDLGHVSLRGRTRPPADTDVVEPLGGVIEYSYCNLSTLESFRWKSTFPYAEKVSTPNSFQCASVVCDLQFTSSTSEPATDITMPDGSILVEATSSNGIVKYSLNRDFNYATEGQVSGSFFGLLPGTYTVLAKDEVGCSAQVTVNVNVPDFYNVKYRLQYTDLKGNLSRADILERGYLGEVVHVKGTGDPVLIEAVDISTNKFVPVIPSTLTLNLISESNFFFRDLFTQDDRKYQIRHYKDFGNTVPSFIPATLEDIGDWDEDTAGNPWSGLVYTDGGVSAGKVTSYAFEVGQTYSFDYEFLATVPATGFRQIRIEITNSSGSNLGANLNITVTSSGTYLGTHTFVAPAGADRIRVYIAQGIFAGDRSYTFNGFTNITAPSGSVAAGLELKWLGYIISQNYKEAYLPVPYNISITAIDGLADLKNFDFVDAFGNKFKNDIITIEAIAEILAKTDLGINIQCAVNKFEEDMDEGVNDDPLAQCKFDATILDETDCFEALTNLLKSFGAKIRQRNGKWFIYCTEEIVHELAYREFNSVAEFVEAGTVNDSVDIKVPIIATRAAFRDAAQVLEIIPSYGKFFLTHKLQKNPSLIKSYSFEQDDLYIDTDGRVLIRNWNVNIANSPGSSFGIKETKAFEGNFNLFVKTPHYKSQSNLTEEIVVTSATGTIEYEAFDAFEISFSYAYILKAITSASSPPFWVRMKWMIRIGTFYYSSALGGWTEDEDYKYNNIYVSNFNEVQNLKIVSDLPAVSDLTEDDFQVEFIFQTRERLDFIDEYGDSPNEKLKAIPTTILPLGTKVKGNSRDPFKYTYFVLSDDQTPGSIEPDDYHSVDNPKVWIKEYQILSGYEMRTLYSYLDNVVLKHFPKATEPPSSITVESTNNPLLKVDLAEEFILNDIDIENINNSERTYKNFFKRLDGSPTQLWHRTYRPGTGKLLDLLSGEYKAQYKRGTNKITGSFDIDTEIMPTSTLREVNDGGRKYMFMGYVLHDALNSIDFDLAELVDVVTDDTSPDIDAGFTTGFSLGFRS